MVDQVKDFVRELPEGLSAYQRGFASGVRMCMDLTDCVPAIEVLGIGALQELDHRRVVRDACKALMAKSALKILGD